MSATWMLLIPAVFIGVTVFRVARRGMEMRRLVTDGVEAKGTVRTKVRFNGAATRTRVLRYDYSDASGQRHSQRSIVTQQVWDSVKEGGPIRIVYSRSRPSLSAPKYVVEQARKALEQR